MAEALYPVMVHKSADVQDGGEENVIGFRTVGKRAEKQLLAFKDEQGQ